MPYHLTIDNRQLALGAYGTMGGDAYTDGVLSGLTGIRQGMASRWQRGRRGVHRHPILPGTLAGLDPIWEQGQFAATAPKCIRNQARAVGKSQGPSDGKFVRGSGESMGVLLCRSAQSNW